jgi:glycosyltransferase involved in cell wall biosynthesis
LKKPRLLIILNRFAVGGPASNTISTAALLSEQFDILLVAGAPDADEQAADHLLEQYKGFRFQQLLSLQRSVVPGNDWKAYRELKHIIRSFQPHIVHTHGAKPGVLGRLAAHRCKVPVILHTFHGHVFHSYFNSITSGLIVRIERWLASYSTALIAINQTLQQELIHQYRIAAAGKIKLIRLGIETNRYQDHTAEKRQQFRKEFGLQQEEIAIGLIGRLVPVKNLPLFVEAAQEVRAQYGQNNKLKFFIVGDGNEKAMLEQLLSSKQLPYTNAGSDFDTGASFIFTSWRTDMDIVLAGLDIVALTSLNEGTPVSLMEAMAAGKAIVSVGVGGIPELIEQGRTGLLATGKEGVVRQLAALINDSSMRQQLSIAASAEAEARLSKLAETKQLAALYNSLLSGS